MSINWQEQKKRRASVAKLINKIKENSKHISDDLRMNMMEIPETTATEGEWKLYDAQNRHIITTMMKGTHLRARTKWRRKMKELKHKREEQRKKCNNSKKLLQLCAEKARVRAETNCTVRES